ncbi:endonuclease/exonuclease/phosphatase family protein [Rapidithrix thailandica]|uniref:Endonuclease/exonuclease/phosphatase family protein n=1 Tax=Rapidithrix thailandica TaxID=413964 RepID=A0AAW9RVI5_9BACT
MARILSFASFNLYNLQLPDTPWRDKRYTQAEYAEKIAWTGQMLNVLDADIIAFQELWSKECLVEAFEKAGLQDAYNLFFIKDTWYDIAVAAAVRKPLAVSRTAVHKNFPEGFRLIKREVDHSSSPVEDEDDDIEVVINKFSRSILQLSVQHPDFPEEPGMEVFVTHLKSKLPTRLDRKEGQNQQTNRHSQALGDALSTIRRVSEATALRMILTNTLKGNDIPAVALGDFNDNVTSNALSIVTAQASYRLYDASHVASSNDKGLYSSAIMQNFRSISDSTYTHEHDGMKDTLDHILFSEQFYPYSRKKLWSFKELKVWNDHIGDNAKYTTDHGLIKTIFVR